MARIARTAKKGVISKKRAVAKKSRPKTGTKKETKKSKKKTFVPKSPTRPTKRTKKLPGKALSVPKVGEIAPAFTLPDQHGKSRSLDAQRGKWVLLYFYPKDDTPGCTKEACMIRDGFPFFEKLDATVFGVSVDSVASHKKFAQKYSLPFLLLSDESKKTVLEYGVWGEKTFMGRKYMGTNRSSFLVSPDGKIAKVYSNVNPAIHADEVLRDLTEMKKS